VLDRRNESIGESGGAVDPVSLPAQRGEATVRLVTGDTPNRCWWAVPGKDVDHEPDGRRRVETAI
jgi:hypothetical protein